MPSKISIIIPMYKVEKYLRRCLDSVKNQTFQDWQAICVDDGSPDKSGKIAENYAKKDKRFVVVHKENGGVSAARNVALKKASGKYIMFLDSDDCIHPQTMEILHTLAEHENVDVVSFEYDRDSHNAPDAVNFPADKMPEFFQNKFDINKIKYKRIKNLITKSTNDDKGPCSWYVQNGMIWMRMYRKDLLSGLQFDTNMRVFEDTLFLSRVLLRRPNAIITRLPLYYYTVNATSALHGKAQAFKDTLVGISRVADEYRRKGNVHDTRIWYKRFFWSLLSRIFHGASRVQDNKDKKEYAKMFNKMKKDGVFDIAPDLHARRYRRRIFRFISQNLNI